MLLSNLSGILFYMFSAVLLFSAFFSVISKKSVHSVLLLILTFFAAAWVFILQGAEFLAMMLIVIYVGAIAVLFLFVVMMLEEPNAVINAQKHSKKRFLFSFFVGCVLFLELFAIILSSKLGLEVISDVKTFSVKEFGNLIYTEYFFEFQTMGLIFFTAMVGAIIITLVPSDRTTKRQNIFTQISRSSKITLVKPESGKGVNL